MSDSVDKKARTWPIGADLTDLCDHVAPGARGLDAYCSLVVYRVLEIVGQEFVSKRAFTETSEKLQSEISSLKSTIDDLSRRLQSEVSSLKSTTDDLSRQFQSEVSSLKSTTNDLSQRLQSEVSSLKSTTTEISNQLSGYRQQTDSSIQPIPTIQRDLAVLKGDYHSENDRLKAEVAAVKTKLTAIAAVADIRVGSETETWDQHIQSPGPWRNWIRSGGGMRHGPWFRTRSRVTWTNPQGSVVNGDWKNYT
jgi:hypothetical protein